MPRLNVPPRAPLWPRLAVLMTVGLMAAGCADSARFQSTSFEFNPGPPRPQADVTGAVNPPPQPSRVVAEPLPTPATPRGAVVATNHAAVGVDRRPEGRWTWDGGSAVTVARGETLEQIARRHGVPASAILQVNGLSHASAIRPGQRLVIPRYVSNAPAAVAKAEPRHGTGDVHVVARGETLRSIARHHGVAPEALAHANKIGASDRVVTGQRLIIPTSRTRMAAQDHPSAPKTESAPRVAASETVASVPAEKANIAKPEVNPGNDSVKTAEPAGAMPSFRWPVKGRIIAGFGARVNGTQNDGINLAVPLGTPIKAADDGVVAYAGNELKGYGNLVLIRHANGYVSAYANASELLVKRGDTVKRGQVIAHAGQTGNVSSPQLHFEIRKGSVPVDPTKYLSGA